MRNLMHDLKTWAAAYEPATARTLVLAFMQILVAAGIGLGNLPNVVDAVLAFVAIAATVVAGRSIRNAVYSPATHESRVAVARAAGYSEAISDVAEGQS